MAAREKAKSRFTITHRIAAEPMTAADYAESERIIAKMIARAFMADHPELFGRCPKKQSKSGEPSDG